MSTDERIGKTVHFILKDSAERLKGEDLVKIIEAARRAGAIVHVSCASWQVLIGVPEQNGRQIEGTLASMGYLCTSRDGGVGDVSTFVMEGAGISIQAQGEKK